MGDQNMKKLVAIKNQPENDNKCAECGASDPDWASYNLGIFLCVDCCGVHRNLGTHISKVKGVKLDHWDSEQIQAMADKGNEASNKQFLLEVPLCYSRPTPGSCQIVREQWIRAKYERLEFQNRDRQLYLKDTKIGELWKKGRDDAKFLRRRFELRVRDNHLVYFTKDSARSPKETILIDSLNCCFVPEKMGNPNGMQISFSKDNGTRHMYVYAEDGKDMMDWYLAIRNAKLMRRKIGLPHLSDKELVDGLTRDFIREGFLYKTGPGVKDAWRRRWFTLDGTTLYYFNDPLSAYANGEIRITRKSRAVLGVPANRNDHNYSFTLRVPDRDYLLSSSSEEDRQQWIDAINSVIQSSQ